MALPPGFKLVDEKSGGSNLPPGFKLIDPSQPESSPASNPGPNTGNSLQSGTVGQYAGWVPNKQDVVNMLPKPQDVPSLIGSMAGGFAKSTPAGIGLAALGSAGMEGLSQLGQRAGWIPGEPPQTSGEALSRIGQKAAIGGLGEGVGRTIINPLMKLGGKMLFPGASAETQAAVRAAESEGIKPLPSMISDNKAVAGGERALEYSPFGGAITKARQKVVEDFGNFAQRVGDAISPTKDPEVNGSLVKEATRGYYETFNDVKNKLYNSVMPQVAETAVNPAPIVEKLKDVIEMAKGRQETGVASYAQGILDRLTSQGEAHAVPTSANVPGLGYPAPKMPTFSEIKDLATGLGNKAKFFDPANPGMQGTIKDLWGTFQNTLDDAIEKNGDSGIKESLKKANDYYHIGKTVLDSKIYKALIDRPQGNEWKIAFNANDPMAYDTVKEVVGPDMMKNLAGQWFKGVLDNSTKNGVISPQLILNNLDKQSALIPKIAQDFPQATAQINKLQQVATQLVKNSDVMKGSQTAPLKTLYGVLTELGASVSLMFTHPVLGATGVGAGLGALGAAKAGTSFATSDMGRNLATVGYPAIQPAVENAVGLVARPATYLGLRGTGEYLKNRLSQKGLTSK